MKNGKVMEMEKYTVKVMDAAAYQYFSQPTITSITYSVDIYVTSMANLFFLNSSTLQFIVSLLPFCRFQL